MIDKLLTDYHLEFLSLKVGCRVSSDDTHVKMPHCWKIHALAHLIYVTLLPQGVMGGLHCVAVAKCSQNWSNP